MMFRGLQVLQFAPSSVSSTLVAAAGGSLAVPTLANGDRARWVLCRSATVTANQTSFAVSASPDYSAASGMEATDIPVVIGSQGVVLNVTGYTHIRFDLISTTGFIISLVSIVPLENQ